MNHVYLRRFCAIFGLVFYHFLRTTCFLRQITLMAWPHTARNIVQNIVIALPRGTEAYLETLQWFDHVRVPICHVLSP